jgi:N-acetylglutamate synthase-like GNAT family acetyltransferase
MYRKGDDELYGIAAYKEQKNNGDNFMELKFFCTLEEWTGLGTRFMSKILHWASTKKHYTDIYTMADMNAVEWFYKNEFVLVDFKEFQESRKDKIQVFNNAKLMHKRIVGFDVNRLDKLNMIPFEDYEPKSDAAKKMKTLILLFR